MGSVVTKNEQKRDKDTVDGAEQKPGGKRQGRNRPSKVSP